MANGGVASEEVDWCSLFTRNVQLSNCVSPNCPQIGLLIISFFVTYDRLRSSQKMQATRMLFDGWKRKQ